MADITPNTVAKYAKKGIGGVPITAAGDAERKINILVYGDSGIGKTVLAGSASDIPEMRDILIIDAEGGTESLVRTYPQCDVARVTRIRDLWTIYDELHRGNTSYSTVVVDSLSELQKQDMMETLKVGHAERPEKVDPDVAGIREWGISLEHMRKIVRAFRDLPINTIFTALVRYEKDPKTGMMLKLPGLQGKAAAELPAFPDIVLYYFSKEVKNIVDGEEVLQEVRIAQSKKTSTTAAKDRTGYLPPAMRNPTMKKIWAAVNNTEANKETEQETSDAA